MPIKSIVVSNKVVGNVVWKKCGRKQFTSVYENNGFKVNLIQKSLKTYRYLLNFFRNDFHGLQCSKTRVNAPLVKVAWYTQSNNIHKIQSYVKVFETIILHKNFNSLHFSGTSVLIVGVRPFGRMPLIQMSFGRMPSGRMHRLAELRSKRNQINVTQRRIHHNQFCS